MKRLLIAIACFISIGVDAQDKTLTVRKTPAGLIYGVDPSSLRDTLPSFRLTGLTNGMLPVYNSTTKKWHATAFSVGILPGLLDSLGNKANRNFDNVASGAIANIKLANSTISGVALGGTLNALTTGYGLSSGGTFTGATARTVQADTTALQTILNFFPKGDTRYLRSSIASSTYLPLTGGTLSGALNGTYYNFSASRSSAYISEIFNTNTTAGTSFGLFIKAGTNNSDYALNINNAANTISLFTIKGDGTIVTRMVGGGDRLVSTNNSGELTGVTIGSGLSLTAGTLTATGGSSGSVTTAGGTAGRIVKFTSASNIEISTIVESGSDITISGNLTSASFIKSGGTSSQFLKADGSVDGSTYLTSSTGVSSITGTSNQVVASTSTGAVTLSLPQSIATSSTPQFTSLGLGASPLYTLDVTKSVSSNYISHIHNTNTTAGTSFGLFIKAGTNDSDYAININSASNAVNLFNVSGAGNAMVRGDLSFGSSSYRAGSTIRRDGTNLIISAGTTGFYVNRHDNSASDLYINSLGNIELKGVTATTGVFSGSLSASNLSGTNTGDQTTIIGNAGTATALQTARNIQGVSFNGTADINPISGTGFVKVSGTTLSYDNNTYLTTASASSTYAPIASPIFTGTVSGITAAMVGAPSGSGTSTGTNTGDQNLTPYALLASPAFTGNPTAPTQTSADNSTKIATTAYVDAAISISGIIAKGRANFNGDGVTTQFDIGAVGGTTMIVTPANTDASGIYYVTKITPSNVWRVTYATPPPSGTSNVGIYYIAN